MHPIMCCSFLEYPVWSWLLVKDYPGALGTPLLPPKMYGPIETGCAETSEFEVRVATSCCESGHRLLAQIRDL